MNNEISDSPHKIAKILGERYKELKSNDVNKIHKTIQINLQDNFKIRERNNVTLKKKLKKYYENQKVICIFLFLNIFRN